MSLRFAEVAYDRYLSLDTDLHGVPSLEEQRRVTAVTGEDEVAADLTVE